MPPPEPDRTAPRPPGTSLIPVEWWDVADALAAARPRPMPLTWWVIELILRDAEALGMTGLPMTPWEEARWRRGRLAEGRRRAAGRKTKREG
jgi:hypothetical protein